MLETEFVKSLQNNYERLYLAEKPEEKRYQYCILNRGGIAGLLPCSLRYINGDAYLYYDITSKQTVSRLFRKKSIDRAWMKDFIWNLRRIRAELERFLLDEHNIIWYPEQVFQELGDNVLSFIYVPYHKDENGFLEMLEFLVERMDYQDEKLVSVVYRMYEQYEQSGEIYLQKQIYEDAEALDEVEMEVVSTEEPADWRISAPEEREERVEKSGKSKGLRAFLETSRKRNRELREAYRRENLYAMEGYSAQGTRAEEFAVAEEGSYETAPEGEAEEDEAKTVYMEKVAERKDETRRLYSKDGEMLLTLGREEVVLGKKEGSVDLVLDNASVSRMHARIFLENGEYFLEDMNSTNGTFKNGLRMKPYEKKTLHGEDEIRIGSVELVFR